MAGPVPGRSASEWQLQMAVHESPRTTKLDDRTEEHLDDAFQVVLAQITQSNALPTNRRVEAAMTIWSAASACKPAARLGVLPTASFD